MAAQPIPLHVAAPQNDFLADFLVLTAGRISPRLFRQWAGISLIAGALERRVWAKVGPQNIFPNMYIVLVGPPGSGKSIIEVTRKLWTEACEPGTKTRVFHVAPDQMTTAALIDTLLEARQTKLPAKGEPLQYHSLLIAAEEMSNFMPVYDRQFISTFVTLFNNKELHREVRRYGHARDISIENPQLNLLGGAQPAFLADTFPENVWDTGIGRRLIMVYSSAKPRFDIFAEPDTPADVRASLLSRLGQFSQLYGQCMWEQEGADRLSAWHLSGGPPTPTHSKLLPYNETRTEFIEKLSIVSAVSRTGKLVIGLSDVNRAIEWLTDAERVMPDIFRAMVGKSDKQVMEELNIYLARQWAASGQKPIPGSKIYKFLSDKLPSEKIERVIGICEKSGYISRVGGTEDLWIPSGKMQETE